MYIPLTTLSALTALAEIFPLPSYTVLSTDPSITYSPAGANWNVLTEPGSSGCGAEFVLGTREGATVTFTFPRPSTSLQWYGYQRSDGGLAELCIDELPCSQVNYYNASTNGTEPPRLLFSLSGLENITHTVVITNLVDPAVGKAGQLTVDRFILDGSAASATRLAAPTFGPETSLSTVPLNFSYHVPLILGDHGPAVNVLLDAGASDSWVVSTFCSSPGCAGHNAYQPSPVFQNLSKEDTLMYGNGGPGETFVAWRVNDTLSFGNLTLPEATFGAAVQVPTGQDVDGNFGIAKAFYSQCNRGGADYPNFVESAFLQKLIPNPVIAFYQLDGTENVPAGVSSQASVGGLDRNKFTGEVDWIPMGPQEMWTNPSSARYVQASPASPAVDATAMFSHPAITFDTGDPGLLGLPHDDWLILMNLLSAQGPDPNGQYLIPCQSSMIWNFFGTQARNYTLSLAQVDSNNGQGMCKPAANDAGQTTNWITGVPFLKEWYVAFHYGANMMGFAERELGERAAGSEPFIG